MKLLTAVSAAALVASTLVIGVTQLRQAAAAGSPTPPYFSCAAGALCVEPLQFRSALPEISNQDNTETRTSTVYNNTDGPVTITGSKFLNGSTQTFLFDAGPNDTCVGHTLRPGDECGFQVTDFAADPVTVTFEVDGTAGGAAVTGTAVIQSNRPIRPDNDLYTENFGASFEVDHVGARSGPQTITLTGYGAVPPPPVHVHLALDGPTALASGTPPSYYDHRWYRVTGANVVDDRPPGFPAEYEINRSDCIGKSVNKEADSIEEGSPSCKVSVTATPHSDGSHEATLDITYCTVEGSTENDCTDAAPRHVLAPLETTVPWNPGPCNTLCVEPLSFLPVNSDSGATYDPVLVRTSTVYNGTAWPLTVTADTFQNADGVFDINPLDTCLGKTIPPGGECGVSVRLHDDGQPHLRTALVVTATRDATCRPPSSGGPSCTVIGIGSITSPRRRR
ncbi:MAG: hypothetical protein AUG49_02850 [Catenulispora sp. 13_1_20CM_3_70_7]|nr:MAG: hypothetical protein AUG49_02850 [Catenulispora sp. 13_1_20CM_3_70_7]